MAFKQIIIRDPLNQLPDLTLFPDSEGYSRAIVNLRKAGGRTPGGATKLTGTPYYPYFTWQINIALVKEDNLNLFEDYLELQNDRLHPQSGVIQNLLLLDQFEPTPAKITPRWNFIQDSSVVRSYQNITMTSGYAIFPVVVSVDQSYKQLLGSCRYKLNFAIEEVN